MRFSLNHFQDVFNLRDEAGKPYILIGGQAVNFWAETYLASEPGLSVFLPFVSRDIDFIGDKAAVLKTAHALGLEARLPHQKLMTAFAGAVVLKSAGGETSIEFLRQVPGVSLTNAAAWAAAVQREGKSIRVLDVISLLACKLNLALTVDQAQRRDVDHVRILFLCVRAFLRETMKAVESGALPARDWLKAVERLLKLAESARGRKAARKLDVNWRLVLPETQITTGKHPMIVRFREKRLPLWLKKVNRMPHGPT